MKNDQDKPIAIEELYPDLTPDQQREAEKNLSVYTDIIRQITDRQEPEQAEVDATKEVSE